MENGGHNHNAISMLQNFIRQILDQKGNRQE